MNVFQALTFCIVDKVFEVRAGKEVILSAGSIGSVQILQLSGIGDSDALTPLGIPVHINNTEVGKNLQDHPLVSNIFIVQDGGSLDHILRNQTAMGVAIGEWERSRTGLVANNVVNTFGFFRLSSPLLEGLEDYASGLKTPHYEMIFTVRSFLFYFLA